MDLEGWNVGCWDVGPTGWPGPAYQQQQATTGRTPGKRDLLLRTYYIFPALPDLEMQIFVWIIRPKEEPTLKKLSYLSR